MAKVTYHGPGEKVEIDGLTIERGKVTELDPEQVARLRADPAAEVTIEDDAIDSPEERERIRATQDDQRDSAASGKKKTARKGAQKES